MEAALANGTPNTPAICKKLIDWFNDHGGAVRWMAGEPHFAAIIDPAGKELWILEVWANGGADLLVKVIENDSLRAEFRRRVENIKGVKLSKASKEPAFDPDIEPLANAETWKQFTSVLQWLVDEYGKPRRAQVT